MSARSTQDEVAAAAETVSCLVMSQAPKIQPAQTAYTSRLLARLQFFVRHSTNAGAAVGSVEQPAPEVVGKQALKAKLLELKGLISADPGALCLAKLDLFQAYHYLLDDGDKKEVDAYVAQVLDKASSGQLASMAGGGTKSRPAKVAKAESSIARFF